MARARLRRIIDLTTSDEVSLQLLRHMSTAGAQPACGEPVLQPRGSGREGRREQAALSSRADPAPIPTAPRPAGRGVDLKCSQARGDVLWAADDRKGSIARGTFVGVVSADGSLNLPDSGERSTFQCSCRSRPRGPGRLPGRVIVQTRGPENRAGSARRPRLEGSSSARRASQDLGTAVRRLALRALGRGRAKSATRPRAWPTRCAPRESIRGRGGASAARSRGRARGARPGHGRPRAPGGRHRAGPLKAETTRGRHAVARRRARASESPAGARPRVSYRGRRSVRPCSARLRRAAQGSRRKGGRRVARRLRRGRDSLSAVADKTALDTFITGGLATARLTDLRTQRRAAGGLRARTLVLSRARGLRGKVSGKRSAPTREDSGK